MINHFQLTSVFAEPRDNIMMVLVYWAKVTSDLKLVSSFMSILTISPSTSPAASDLLRRDSSHFLLAAAARYTLLAEPVLPAKMDTSRDGCDFSWRLAGEETGCVSCCFKDQVADDSAEVVP